MDNIEMIEKLREKADISYRTANEILEGVNWDMDAAETALIKEGLIREETAMMTTKNTNTENRTAGGSFRDALRKGIRWFGDIVRRGMNNNFCIDLNSGRHFEIPVTIMVLLTIAGMTIIPLLLIIAFFTGCRFNFSGPDLGKERINDEMAKIRFTSEK